MEGQRLATVNYIHQALIELIIPYVQTLLRAADTQEHPAVCSAHRKPSNTHR